MKPLISLFLISTALAAEPMTNSIGMKLVPISPGSFIMGQNGPAADYNVKKHAEKNPVIFKVMGVDGRTSAGWLSITHTVGRTLHEQGLRDRELAAAVWLFCSQAIGLLLSEYGRGSFRSSLSLSQLEQLGPEQQAFFLELRNYHVPLTTEELLEEGFNDLIASLERKIARLGKK